MKIVAYTDVTEAITVAKATDSTLIRVTSSFASNLVGGQEGWVIAANKTDLYDANGLAFRLRVRCDRAPTDMDEGHFTLYLEKADA